MGRQRQRACLEQGLSLNLNVLARLGIIRYGELVINNPITWGVPPEYSLTGTISAELIGHTGWLQIQIGKNIQRIEVVSEARHFGGRQRYFVCPTTGRKVSVLWRPPGADEFPSRQTWGKSVG
jgi:hypothetical protein